MDQRAVRTRKALRDAFVALAATTPFEKIRVQDILDLASVGRTAFYSHFRDKEDLLVSLFEEMMDRIESSVDPRSPLVLPAAELLFEHFLERADLCRGLRRGDKMTTLHRVAESHLRRYYERKLANANPTQASLVAVYAASTFVSLWHWWVSMGRRISPSDMAATYEALVAPPFHALQADGKVVSTGSVKGNDGFINTAQEDDWGAGSFVARRAYGKFHRLGGTS